MVYETSRQLVSQKGLSSSSLTVQGNVLGKWRETWHYLFIHVFIYMFIWSHHLAVLGVNSYPGSVLEDRGVPGMELGSLALSPLGSLWPLTTGIRLQNALVYKLQLPLRHWLVLHGLEWRALGIGIWSDIFVCPAEPHSPRELMRTCLYIYIYKYIMLIYYIILSILYH